MVCPDTVAEVFTTTPVAIRAATLDEVVDHILHPATIAAIDHVGIGTDFDGVPALPDQLQTAATLPLVTAALLARGVSEADAEYSFALVHLALGAVDEAITCLGRACDERSSSSPFLRVNPRLTALYGDPRFAALCRRVFGE
ncbi:MAG: membrane dipeptidase [Acidobacteriota bacterium]